MPSRSWKRFSETSNSTLVESQCGPPLEAITVSIIRWAKPILSVHEGLEHCHHHAVGGPLDEGRALRLEGI